MISRRKFSRAIALAGAAVLVTPARASAAGKPQTTSMGLVAYCLGIHRRAYKTGGFDRDLSDPLVFLEECRRLGSGGMQFDFKTRTETEMRAFRKVAERHGMHVEAIVPLPREDKALDTFEKQLATAKAAGATVARTVMLPGRRYEQFKTLEEFRAACDIGLAALERAEPIARRAGIRLAVENHKDHRADEKIGVMKKLDSEFVGMCVDFGNNLALMEDPLETMQAFAPWAVSAHIKDHGVRECAEGFRLADVALGDGILDLPAMVAAVRKARPDVHFNLEVITRDPLLVPVKKPDYRATLPDLRDEEIERIMELVKTNGAAEPLPVVSELPEPGQLAAERNNVERSIRYAADILGL